jgi:hypothetical protein
VDIFAAAGIFHETEVPEFTYEPHVGHHGVRAFAPLIFPDAPVDPYRFPLNSYIYKSDAKTPADKLIPDEQFMRQLRAGEIFIVEHWKVTYLDDFGVEHWQTNCDTSDINGHKPNPDSVLEQACTKYNDADRNR